MKKQRVDVFHVQKNTVSSPKQKDQEFMKQLRTLHQKPELESKHLHLLFRNVCDPHEICAKCPSKRARKALKNASRMVIEE